MFTHTQENEIASSSELKENIKIILKNKFLSLKSTWLLSIETPKKINNKKRKNYSDDDDNNDNYDDENNEEKNAENDHNEVKGKNKKIVKGKSKNVKKDSVEEIREMLSYGNGLRICNDIAAITIGDRNNLF